jgi:hypothetical protein
MGFEGVVELDWAHEKVSMLPLNVFSVKLAIYTLIICCTVCKLGYCLLDRGFLFHDKSKWRQSF